MHAIYVQKDHYIDDLQTIASGFEGTDEERNDFYFLEASFVEDIWVF